MANAQLTATARYRVNGQIREAMSNAARETVLEALREGERVAKEKIGTGKYSTGDDPRYPGHTADGIYGELTARNVGRLVSSHPKTRFVEEGGKPHLQTGSVTFFWQEKNRDWLPYMHPGLKELSAPGGSIFPGAEWIKHPGSKGKWFMKAAKEEMTRRIVQIAKQKYPG